ncbi:MAG: FHA domain-containing protein [candidate division WOR-3 bacterium]
MKCPICGFQNREGVRFCERCLGALDIFSVKAEDEGVFCSKGHWNPSGVRFCTTCGEALSLSKGQESPFLLVEEETGQFVYIPLKDEGIFQVIIGRKSQDFTPDVDLSIFPLSATVSRKHALLVIDPSVKTFVIRDLGSTNGTYLNGARLEPGKDYRVSPGDTIGFSKKLNLVLEVREQ